MKSDSGDREVLRHGSWIFSLFELIFAFGALVVAGQAWSRRGDAKEAVHELAAGGLLGDQVKVGLG
jgi:hypothetical protein